MHDIAWVGDRCHVFGSSKVAPRQVLQKLQKAQDAGAEEQAHGALHFVQLYYMFESRLTVQEPNVLRRSMVDSTGTDTIQQVSQVILMIQDIPDQSVP